MVDTDLLHIPLKPDEILCIQEYRYSKSLVGVLICEESGELKIHFLLKGVNSNITWKYTSTGTLHFYLGKCTQLNVIPAGAYGYWKKSVSHLSQHAGLDVQRLGVLVLRT